MSKEKRDEDKSVFDLIEGLTRVDSERTRRFYANDDARVIRKLSRWWMSVVCSPRKVDTGS